MASPAEKLRQPQTYQGTKLDCDIVMKGGITSGVTYPWAICQIGATYRLHSIGGSSAGAIAAAAAAAAERARSIGKTSATAGYPRLADMPNRLAGPVSAGADSTLFSLFQPQASTEPFFRILRTVLTSKGATKLTRVRKVIGSALRSFSSGAVVLGILAVLTLLIVGWLDRRPGIRGSALDVALLVVVLLAGLVFALVAGIATSVWVASKRAKTIIPQNMFGICSGFNPPGDPTGAPCPNDMQPDGKRGCLPKPLTTWLADEFDAIAGNDDPTKPLTLGDLDAAGVALKVFTTNLTTGTPCSIPFKRADYSVAPNEFYELFPERILDWMTGQGAEAPGEDLPELPALPDGSPLELVRLPDCERFPVVVAARMSLSFPLLLSAVPLWAVDWGDKVSGRKPRWVHCWFSDGGITSNFPIHFFDGPIPRWPTFGLNLGPFDPPGAQPDPTDQRNNIWAPKDNKEGLVPRFSEVETLVGFAHAIADTMQNWSDNGQTHLPGYRDRIVVVKHSPEEGGMNLNMPAARITAFAERGRCAGERLVERFSKPAPGGAAERLGWDNHRFIRYRTFMALLETTLGRFQRGFDAPPGPGRDYEDLIADPPSYRWCSVRGPESQLGRATELTHEVLDLATRWVPLAEEGAHDTNGCVSEPKTYDQNHPFQCKVPRPKPALRVTPEF